MRQSLTAMANKAIERALGEAVTYTPLAGSPVSIKGIFNAMTAEIDAGTGFRVMTPRPTLEIRLAALAAAPKQGDQVAVRSQTYKITSVTKDGEGGAVLALAKT